MDKWREVRYALRMMKMNEDRTTVFCFGVEWIETTFGYVADQIEWDELRIFAECRYEGGFAQLRRDALDSAGHILT